MLLGWILVDRKSRDLLEMLQVIVGIRQCTENAKKYVVIKSNILIKEIIELYLYLMM